MEGEATSRSPRPPFVGFPAGPLSSTPLPNLFFSKLLPAIDDLAELKVTLHLFWLLYRKRGSLQWAILQELAADRVLRSSLGQEEQAEATLRQALERGVARASLLRLVMERAGKVQELFLLNTAKGRELVEKLRSGELDIGQVVLEVSPTEGRVAERPNIFSLYEQNIGLLTPLIAEELKEAERDYPPDWIEEALRQAVEYNRRNWRYVRRILERWRVEGRGDEEIRRPPKTVRPRWPGKGPP